MHHSLSVDFRFLCFAREETGRRRFVTFRLCSTEAVFALKPSHASVSEKDKEIATCSRQTIRESSRKNVQYMHNASAEKSNTNNRPYASLSKIIRVDLHRIRAILLAWNIDCRAFTTAWSARFPPSRDFSRFYDTEENAQTTEYVVSRELNKSRERSILRFVDDVGAGDKESLAELTWHVWLTDSWSNWRGFLVIKIRYSNSQRCGA